MSFTWIPGQDYTIITNWTDFNVEIDANTEKTLSTITFNLSVASGNGACYFDELQLKPGFAGDIGDIINDIDDINDTLNDVTYVTVDNETATLPASKQHANLSGTELHAPGTHASSHASGASDAVSLSATQINIIDTAEYFSSSDVENALAEVYSDKTDKVISATNGNFAGLDGTGNLTDSGYSYNDFALDAGNIITMTAGQIISALKVLTVDILTGKAIYADKDYIAGENRILGISLDAVGIDESVEILTGGDKLNNTWAWDISKGLYLGNSGEITQTVPITGFLINLGTVLSPTEIFIRILESIELV